MNVVQFSDNVIAFGMENEFIYSVEVSMKFVTEFAAEMIFGNFATPRRYAASCCRTSSRPNRETRESDIRSERARHLVINALQILHNNATTSVALGIKLDFADPVISQLQITSVRDTRRRPKCKSESCAFPFTAKRIHLIYL